jgi:hypothetical protein
MAGKMRSEALVHPEHGRIPARKVLECIFALSPQGRILHHHLEEVEVNEESGIIVYTLNGCNPHLERRRCRIIPPMVPEFPALD